MKKMILFALASVLSISSAFAAQTAGLCEAAAINHALETAPGTDESSFATVTAIQLVKSETFGPKSKIENYYVQIEDQGGPAASLISVRATDKSSLANDIFAIDCEVVAQSWVE